MSHLQPKDPRRPRPLHISRSFTRLASPSSSASPSSPSRTRATTIQTPTIHRIPEARDIADIERVNAHRADIFDTLDENEDTLDSPSVAADKKPVPDSPATFDQLPIEIRSLTDRFLRSLSIKAHAAPLNIDAIADLFQDFYVQAESHISTHIATLSTRIGRENSPAPSVSSKASSIIGRKRGNSGAGQPSPGDGEQQMLTPSEVADRRKARRLLDKKRIALEEAVERGLCEKIYEKIYRHRSADDEERDAKLRSRTAALALVGIGLKELHVNIETDKTTPEQAKEEEGRIAKLLAPAMDSLKQMDDEHYPLGKLHKLTEAHKNIVETLSQLFPSSSSADEVLPTLIYTLIMSDPESLTVVSNLHFVQLFRSRNRMDGEAAYCLVNLEAAISFLETVDLSSLRADEAPEGPPKSSSRPQTPNKEAFDAAPVRASSPRSITPSVTPASATATEFTPGEIPKPLPSPSSMPRPAFPHRRLSSLIQAQAERIEEGRVELLNSADQAFDAINSTLENSFKFLFGKMKEQQGQGHDSPVILPKTLEDARKLISSPTLLPEPAMGDEGLISGRSSIHESPVSETIDDPLSRPVREKPERDVLSIVGGRLRDRSADSSISTGSGKRVGFDKSPLAKPTPSPAGSTASAADQMGNLMNTFNPLKSFSVPSFGGFRRSVSAASTPAAVPSAAEKSKQLGHMPEKVAEKKEGEATEGEAEQNGTKSEVKDEADLSAMEALAQLRKTKPPVRRFMEVTDIKELKIGEIEELLKDYRRLADAVREAISP
ncbi:hypothetical protein AAFC00_001492 [Neodothiora populina]|uniref:VPS9 domain-containing protein n=1 Tax=Neodothiora populina TaxID=2781224 RepID=A0ABR3PP32_9PEZI